MAQPMAPVPSRAAGAAPGGGSAAIEISGVRKTFGAKVAVQDLDLRVPAGSVCAFLGPNGAGKTTTIRMVMSILFPDSGQIRVLGRASALESKDRIGYLPEERGVYRKMKVASFLTYMGRLKGLDAAGPGGGLEAKVLAWLDRVQLADCAKKKCQELSKGMQQKVQFIASVLHEPELIILDEPFSGLDPVNSRLLRELVDEQHRAGRTLIFSTHVMSHAEQLCDHVFMINRGVKVLDSSMAELRDRYDPRTIVVEPLTGDGESAAAALRGLPGVESIIPAERSAEVHLAADASPQATMQAVSQRLPVRRLELARASLEDIFITKVSEHGGPGSELADAAALRMSLRENASPDAGAQSKPGQPAPGAHR